MIRIDLREPCRRKALGSSKEENEIREIFYQQWEHMKEQTETVYKEIERWRSRNIRVINSHAEEQLQILHNDYNQRRAAFDRDRENNINAANQCRQGKNDELFNQIKNQSRSLAYHIGQLRKVKIEVEHLLMTSVSDQNTTQADNRTNTYPQGFSNRVSSTTDGTGSVGRGSGLGLLNAGSDQSGTASSLDNNNRSGISSANNDSSTEKCSTCLMIFPAKMSATVRRKHAQEHEAMILGDGNVNG